MTGRNSAASPLALGIPYCRGFIPMGFALGKRIVILGLACIVLAASGLLFSYPPFLYIAIADGILKIGFGVSMAGMGLARQA